MPCRQNITRFRFDWYFISRERFFFLLSPQRVYTHLPPPFFFCPLGSFCRKTDIRMSLFLIIHLFLPWLLKPTVNYIDLLGIQYLILIGNVYLYVSFEYQNTYYVLFVNFCVLFWFDIKLF